MGANARVEEVVLVMGKTRVSMSGQYVCVCKTQRQGRPQKARRRVAAIDRCARAGRPALRRERRPPARCGCRHYRALSRRSGCFPPMRDLVVSYAQRPKPVGRRRLGGPARAGPLPRGPRRCPGAGVARPAVVGANTDQTPWSLAPDPSQKHLARARTVPRAQQYRQIESKEGHDFSPKAAADLRRSALKKSLGAAVQKLGAPTPRPHAMHSIISRDFS
jgi:hypothetical protein